MKKLMNYASLFFIGATIILSSCKKSEDPTPDDPNAQLVVSTLTTTNMGNTLTANVIDTVETGSGNVKIRLDVSGSNNFDHIFIIKSEDNDLFEPVIVTSSITNSYGTFSAGSAGSGTLGIPNLSSFIVDIILPIRSTTGAVTDVYKIWITNGAGSFTKPTKNRDLGMAVITLKYVASTSNQTFVTATLDMGSQSAVPASLLVTSGQVSVLNTADYNDSPSSSDLRLTTMTTGQKDNASTAVWLFSPANVPTGPTADGSPVFTVPVGSNTTYIALYNGATPFASVTATDIAGLTVGTGTSIQVTAGNVYMFKTAASPSKIGLIKINSLTAESDSDKGYVANVTVKALN
jgi:hypothetical protein